jgi:predicted TIM-barrel fold metal-dependent hydrolase
VLHNTMFIESCAERPTVDVALCKSWNRWLGDIWRQSGNRLRWSCMPPLLSMPDALDQIRWSKENGAVAVCLRPVEGNRLLADPYFYPVYDQAQQLDLAIAIHIANGNPWLSDLYNHPTRIASTFHRFRVPTVASFNDILLSEIHEQFPKLRFGFIEASAQWVPWVMHEAKNRFKTLGRPWPANLLKEYGMFVTCENSDDIPYVVREAGEDNLVIGTDYGHTDISSDVDAIRIFRERKDLTPAVKQKTCRQLTGFTRCDNNCTKEETKSRIAFHLLFLSSAAPRDSSPPPAAKKSALAFSPTTLVCRFIRLS